ncbi:polynucleotide kinase-phosphatase [Thermoflavimicrobium dichotomicum]|uniref:Protein phosphatase n=1 Tax=Thermoflavimicrobium dichotomicum TaxID=46223 RepID=A0A1I3RMF1_9BACL|nr:polynucleotide kinase-phosphatase [Thermoflavimicrobium dichotomicum]SFJ47794.1 protein phosphatase [Thermoflavimicrobium dichotomicum]
MELIIPKLSLVVLIGASGSGKSTFARKHFLPTEILSSDFFRGLIADDENDQSASKDAFEVLHYVAGKRLAAGRLTVIDATNLQEEGRKQLLEIAWKYHVIPVAIVFNLPEKICQEHNQARADRTLPKGVIHKHCVQLKKSLNKLKREGFRYVYRLNSIEEVDAVTICRQPLWTDRREETGPLDIIGDVHGCFDELISLLQKLGYKVEEETRDGDKQFLVTHPDGRKAVFVGDLVDRGPNSPDVLRLVMDMVRTGQAYCVMGNHDDKLLRKLKGRQVQVNHGLEVTLKQFEHETEEWKERVRKFLEGIVSHYVFDQGKLVVAHAGLREEYQGRASRVVREFALYGETTGEVDEYGLPVRVEWARDYRGKALVVYGHTPHREPVWLNHTVNIDTGCVFGGKLTAFRYPEKETVSVPAQQEYAKNPYWRDENREFVERQDHDGLDIRDVSPKFISTRYIPSIRIVEEQAIAAVEALSRYTVHSKWLIYLPPTMSPSETAKEGKWLEHPREAFAYYQKQGLSHVICEEKHMGSRAIVIVCRNEEVAVRRFGLDKEALGICYTRTGRRFFTQFKWEQTLLERLRQALERSGFWEELQTDWVCLDAELMPWSAKAQELLRTQYAAVGAAATHSLGRSVELLEQARQRGLEINHLLTQYQQRLANSERFVQAYRQYCWKVESPSDLKLAPFHLLATEGKVHADRDHLWHMQQIAKFCRLDEDILLATRYQVIDLNDPASIEEGIHWWEDLTEQGGEGMVVKPLAFVPRGPKGLIQPAIKCRGREYLRIIYGPEYTAEAHIERLRVRGLKKKRSLALREFALGLEALERFVAREPLYRVHECIFGILALEAEPVEPTL